MNDVAELQARSFKRLIVCCDGTWEDHTSDTDTAPSNITRICRALKQYAHVKRNGVSMMVPQIVYYQKGVGTGVVDQYIGGLSGAGLSANVRSAYDFLAENYDEGDELFFFGFSRGAYTARAVAGLVADMGLLSPRGLDNFSTVYKDYYKNKKLSYNEETRQRLGFRPPLPRFTIRVIGVFDTVSFHDSRLNGLLFGERFELPNTNLSSEVRYAFHALSLDETRQAFAPTLWHCPEKVEDQELVQVWFSGGHGDVGGGNENPRLSNISLAWMISNCMKDDQLAFDLSYLMENPPPPVLALGTPWATSQGQADRWQWIQYVEAAFFGWSNRTPMKYKDEHREVRYTNEHIHESINDRNIVKSSNDMAEFSSWPSKVAKRKVREATWLLIDGLEIPEFKATDLERALQGRIRTVHALQVDPI